MPETETVELADLGLTVTELLDDYNRRIDEAQRQVQYLQGAGGLIEPLSNVAGYNQVGLDSADPTLVLATVEQATFVGQAQLLLAGDGITFTQPDNSPFLRISMSDPTLCFDAVVDPGGDGSHTTVEAAIVTALAASGDHFTILICDDVTMDTVSDIGGIDKTILITGLMPGARRHPLAAAGADRYAGPVISAATGAHMFSQTTSKAGTARGLIFSDLGLVGQDGMAILDVDVGNTEIDFIEFNNVFFGEELSGGAYLVTNDLDALISLANIDIRVNNCGGTLMAFYENNSIPPDMLHAFNNVLTMNQFWTSATSQAPDFAIIEGGYYRLTTTSNISESGVHLDLQIKNLTIRSAVVGDVFTQSDNSGVTNLTLENITLIAGNAGTNFGTFQYTIGGARGIFIHGIHGKAESGVTPTGTFLTVSATYPSPYVADIHAPEWGTVYSGPTITPSVPPVIDHGATIGLGDDDHTQYLLADGTRALTGDWDAGAFTITVLVLKTDTINEETPDTGVTIDSVLHLDGRVDGTDIALQAGFFNGTFIEQLNASVSESVGVVTLSLQKQPTGDLTMVFSDGETVLDCTPALDIILTLGTDAIPQTNYIYIPQSTKVLTKSTTQWPSAEHIKVGFYLVPSAAFVASDGCYIQQQWNDFRAGVSIPRGHMSHIAEQIRVSGAKYFSGIDPAGTTSYLTIGVGTVDYKATSGVIYQLHRHASPAVDTSTGDKVLVVNWSGDAYHDITDLYDIVADSTGTVIGNNKWFNLVIWGVANKGGTYEPAMINLPSGFYNSQASAEADLSGYDNFDIPREFGIDSSTGFEICRLTVQKQSTTWAFGSVVDLRERGVTGALGGASSVATEFPDSVFVIFDTTDNTKILQFQVDQLTTATTRTITMPDNDVTLLDAAQAEAITGLWNFTASGLGDTTDYDLTIGDVTTPDYGIVQIGNASFGRTSHNAASLDLDGAFVFRNMGGPVTGQIEFVWTESAGPSLIRFALPKSGVGNATYNPRSMLLAGPAVNDDDVVTVGYWQTINSIFHNLACDTAVSGADLGVQNDLEVEGDIFTDSIKESTPGADITMAHAVVMSDTLTVDTYAAIGTSLDEIYGLQVARAWNDAAASHVGTGVQIAVTGTGTGATRTLIGLGGSAIWLGTSKPTLVSGLDFTAFLSGASGASAWYGTRVGLGTISGSGSVDVAIGYELIQNWIAGIQTLDQFTGYHCPDFSDRATGGGSNIFGFRVDALDASATPNRYPFWYGDVGSGLWYIDDTGLMTATAGMTVTGVADFGGATSLEIPNSATPTVDVDGELALDTTVADFSHGILKYFGGEEMAIVAFPVAELTSPTDGYGIVYNATADEFELGQHAAAGHTGKIGETDLEIIIPFAKPLVASADTTLSPIYEYKKQPSNIARRINRWYVKMASSPGGTVTFQLYRNGAQLSNAQISITSVQTEGEQTWSVEQELADNDELLIQQTTARTDDIQVVAHIIGDKDVVDVATYS